MTQPEELRDINTEDFVGRDGTVYMGKLLIAIAEKLNGISSSKLSLVKQQERERAQEALEQERQFILNVLDGIDIADEQMGNKGGGTKAIRLALQSRPLQDLLKE